MGMQTFTYFTSPPNRNHPPAGPAITLNSLSHHLKQSLPPPTPGEKGRRSSQKQQQKKQKKTGNSGQPWNAEGIQNSGRR